jgi:hypothetical protein
LQRDSLITQTELIKYNLFEQIQQFDTILNNYRVSLNTFRLTINELEQQLKQQTDNELIHFELSNLFPRQTISDDTHQLILILKDKIDEKKSLNIQLEKTIDNFQEKIFKQKQVFIKKENDYKAMDHIDQQLNHNINVYHSFEKIFSSVTYPAIWRCSVSCERCGGCASPVGNGRIFKFRDM